LPFEEKIFYFDPREFRQLFPERVVAWMEQHPRSDEDAGKYAPLRPLPCAADLPVVFAARLSLSFPFLISAIPLYTIDYSRTAEPRQPEKCWFSDGGISSNFPVHLFDDPLPCWPTFAINLRPFHPDHPRDLTDESKNVYMPDTNAGGVTEWWTRFENPAGKGNLAGFLGAILNAMQNWTDNTQLRVPGYRDRIAHVSLEDEEGGLNLNMPAGSICSVSQRGRAAGQRLSDKFSQPPASPYAISWDDHRWVRYRSTMACVATLLAEARERLTEPALVDGDRSYQELITRPLNDPPSSYKWRAAVYREAAIAGTEKLLEVLEHSGGRPTQHFAQTRRSPLPPCGSCHASEERASLDLISFKDRVKPTEGKPRANSVVQAGAGIRRCRSVD
jgi:hypothetical protein